MPSRNVEPPARDLPRLRARPARAHPGALRSGRLLPHERRLRGHGRRVQGPRPHRGAVARLDRGLGAPDDRGRAHRGVRRLRRRRGPHRGHRRRERAGGQIRGRSPDSLPRRPDRRVPGLSDLGAGAGGGRSGRRPCSSPPMDLQPMAVAPRAPGEYAPAAGARAVESARRGGRATARRACPARERGRGAGPRPRSGWAPAAARPRARGRRRVAGAVRRRGRDARGRRPQRGAARRGERHRRRALGRLARDLPAQRPRARRHEHDLVVLHDAALGLAAGLEAFRWSGAVTATSRGPSPRRSPCRAAASTAAASCSCRDASFAPAGTAASRWPSRRRASIPSTRATSSSSPACPAGWCGRSAWTSSGRSACRCSSSTAGTTPTRPSSCAPRTRGGARAPARAGRAARERRRQGWQAAKEVSDYVAGSEGVFLVTSYEGLGGLELGALRLLARVVIERL